MTKSIKVLFAWTTIIFLIRTTNAMAGGFVIPYQSAKSMGLAAAVTAGVNDPSAVYFNPSALGEVAGNNLMVNGSYINLVNSVENSGRNAVNKHDDNFLATLFANYHIPSSDFTLGIGTYSPFGLATTYDRNFTRFAAERSELRTIYVTPALSWHPSSYFSLGVGLSFIHASGMFSRALCFDTVTGCSTPGGPFEGRLRVTDSTNTFAYNIGLLAKPTDNIKLGFSYRSRADIRFDNADAKLGDAFSPNTTKADVRPLPLPPVINTGVYWQIAPSSSVELVYEYTRWSEFNRFAARFSPTPFFFGVVPIPGFILPQEWKNTSALRFGTSYQWNKQLQFRAGLGIEESPIPNNTLNPSIPGADALSLNAGMSYSFDRFTFDFGYVAAFYKDRKVTNSQLEGTPATGIPFTGAPGKDKHRNFNNLLSLGATYRF